MATKKVDNQDQKHYQSLFNLTKKMIDRGEKHMTALSKVSQSKVRTDLIASSQKWVMKLQKEADKLEKLGWPKE